MINKILCKMEKCNYNQFSISGDDLLLQLNAKLWQREISGVFSSSVFNYVYKETF